MLKLNISDQKLEQLLRDCSIRRNVKEIRRRSEITYEIIANKEMKLSEYTAYSLSSEYGYLKKGTRLGWVFELSDKTHIILIYRFHVDDSVYVRDLMTRIVREGPVFVNEREKEQSRHILVFKADKGDVFQKEIIYSNYDDSLNYEPPIRRALDKLSLGDGGYMTPEELIFEVVGHRYGFCSGTPQLFKNYLNRKCVVSHSLAVHFGGILAVKTARNKFYYFGISYLKTGITIGTLTDSEYFNLYAKLEGNCISSSELTKEHKMQIIAGKI